MADREKVFNAIRNCVTEPKCKDCPWEDCENIGCKRTKVPVTLLLDALNVLKEQQETIVSLQGTICKLNAALAEQPKQKFFVDSDGKMTPLPIQKHGHWVFDPDGMDWNIPAWKCSECHCRNDNIPPNLERTNPLRWSGSKFCPNCGAKMDEEVINDASKNS